MHCYSLGPDVASNGPYAELQFCVWYRGRNAQLVSENEPLDAVFKLFMTCYHHMLLATDRSGTVTGLITLEDVMEEILQACPEPYDQTVFLQLRSLVAWPARCLQGDKANST